MHSDLLVSHSKLVNNRRMSSKSRSLEDIISELSPTSREQVREYAERLLEHRETARKTLRQNWAGALKDFAAQYTSVELQKKASEWRLD